VYQCTYLCACVSEEGAASQAPSDTLGYINLAGLAIGLVALRGPMHLCACVSEEGGDGESAGSQALSDTLTYINLAGLATGPLVHCVDQWTSVHV